MQDNRSERDSHLRMSYHNDTRGTESETEEAERAGSNRRQRRRNGHWWQRQPNSNRQQPLRRELVIVDPNEDSESTTPDNQRAQPQQHSIRSPVSLPYDSMGNGSHTYDRGEIVGCTAITIGNTSASHTNANGHSTPNYTNDHPTHGRTSGHKYNGILISQSRSAHVGNTGPGNGGHHFIGLRVKDTEASYIGDFDSAHTKENSLQAAQNSIRQGQYHTGA
ncbi:hypothetical protein F4803DRAFT_518040 [Xylaria telfairii]|nr:hypothetical protein F4803DRAFT_518040 [Xylaria telfairii]